MILSENEHVAVILAYFLSLALAFGSAHSFAVMSTSDFFLYGVMWLSAPVVITFLDVKHHYGYIAALAHIVLAALIHPALILKDSPFIDTNTQFEMLRAIHAHGQSWWLRADMAYDLARSLRENVLMSYRLQNPIMFWLHPPTVVLVIWATLFAFFWPKRECTSSH